MPKSGIGIACLFSTVALSAGTAAAQTAAPSDTLLEEIIVTAQKREERLSDVPLSITAATGDQLLDQGVVSTADLTKVVPGFSYVASSYGSPLYTIRGIGFFDEALGISPTVSVYVDQVPLPFGRMTEGAALDVERVEVLKGPQGTLFGQNSTGGAINYIANKPTESFAAGLDLTYGRFDQLDGGGFISGALGDKVRARLAVRAESRDDWQKSYTRDDEMGQRDFKVARLLVDIDATDSLRLELNANGWINKSDTAGKRYMASTPATAVGNPNYNADAPGFPNLQRDLQNYPRPPAGKARYADWDPNQDLTRDDDFHQFSLRADQDVGDWGTLTSISSYAKLKVDTLSDNDGTNLPSHRMNLVGDLETVSQELRLANDGAADPLLRWMIGGNYQRDDIDDQQRLTFNGSNTGLAGVRFTGLTNLNTQKVDTYAAFGNVDYDLTDQLTLQGSLRYTKQTRDYEGCLKDNGNGDVSRAFAVLSTNLSRTPTTIAPGACVTLDPVTNKPLPIVRDELDDNNLSWRINLSWKPGPDTLLYANVTKGYKAGSFATLPAIRPAQLAPLLPESLLAYEAGFKVTALERMLQVTGAGFYYDYENKQLLGFVNTGFPFGQLPGAMSVPKSRVVGAELDATLRPSRDLTLRLAGAYLDTKVTHSTAAVGPLGAAIDIKGEQFPATPPWQVTSDAEYRFDLSGDWQGFVGANLSYRSSTPSFFGSGTAEAQRSGNPLLANFQLKGYSLLDLRAGAEFDGGRYRVELWGRNVTDKYYNIFVNRVYDTTVATAGMPATYGITLRARY